MSMKFCPRCDSKKSFFDFGKDKRRKDGLSCYCYSCKKKSDAASYKKHRESRCKKGRQYYIENKDACIQNATKRQKEKKIEINNYWKLYRKSEKNRMYRKRYETKRSAEDVCFRLAKNLRRRINHAIKCSVKSGSSIRDLGCTVFELKLHLESKFTEGMSWDNYGLRGWHADHIIPLSKFDLSNIEEFRKANHFSNLQPLWWRDNIVKSNE